jgi:hypothetical protein
MISSKGLESGQQLFSKVCVWVLFLSGFCYLAFQERTPWFLGTPNKCNSPLSLQGWSHKGWVWFFVRILEVVIRGSWCVVFLSIILSSGATVSRKPDCVICVGWGIYSTVCKVELKFPWKSNVVLDSCGSEDFEKKDQWAQESEIKAIWSLKNLKPLYDEKSSFFVSLWTELRWPLAQASVKVEKCICHLIYTCFAFCLFTLLVFVTRPLSGHIKPKNVGFQLRDPDLVQAWDICNISK